MAEQDRDATEFVEASPELPEEHTCSGMYDPYGCDACFAEMEIRVAGFFDPLTRAEEPPW